MISARSSRRLTEMDPSGQRAHWPLLPVTLTTVETSDGRGSKEEVKTPFSCDAAFRVRLLARATDTITHRSNDGGGETSTMTATTTSVLVRLRHRGRHGVNRDSHRWTILVKTRLVGQGHYIYVQRSTWTEQGRKVATEIMRTFLCI